MFIDAHQHFWNLERGDYQWLTSELKPIYKNFLPVDLKPTIVEANIDGTIVVQATDTIEETQYLLDLADETEWILGVVGWVDLTTPTAPEKIKKFAKHSKFVGVRPMIQGIKDDNWMLKSELAPAIETLIELQLGFDALVLPRHLQPLHEFLELYEGLKVIIDHGAKPDINNKAWQPWANDLAAIAKFSHVYCKLSGLITEASTDWAEQDIAPYAQHILTNFGSQRTVFGSDWPVLNLAGEYDNWLKMAWSWVPDKDRHDVFGGNAKRFYLHKSL